MALNNYVLVTVKRIIGPGNGDVLGDDSVLVLGESMLETRLDIYRVPQSLSTSLEQGDLVVCDLGMTAVPNTDQQVAQKKEVVKITR